MTRFGDTARDLGKWLAVSSAAVAIACASVTTRESPPDPKNKLPAGVAKDAGEFRQRLVSGGFPVGPGHTRNRTADCFFSCEDVQVRIEAVGNTLLIDPTVAPPPNTGVPVAHLYNLDENKREKYYGMKPHKNAEYYLWVDAKPGTPNASRWTLLEVPIGNGNVTAGVPKDFALCNSPDPGVPRYSQADFAEYQHSGVCAFKRTAAKSNMSEASVMGLQPMFDAISLLIATLSNYLQPQGGWIECKPGCCT
jgi:hypothetical protein